MANKLDQLFRENLDQLEMKPSAEAWGQVKDQLAGKKRAVWVLPMKIAAAVIVILTATLLIRNAGDDEQQPLISAIDHPANHHVEEWRIDVPQYTAKTEAPDRAVEPSGQSVAASEEEEESVKQEEELFEKMEMIRVAGLDQPKLDVDLAPRHLVIAEDKVEEPYIKITYIPSPEKASVTDGGKDESKLTKVIAIAREVSSSDILADIREAKDNLFRRNN